MHDDPPRSRPQPRRKLCLSCQYPTLRLDNFEGDSSRDAPACGDRGIDSSAEMGWSFVLFPWRLIEKLWRGGDGPKRKKQVARLRADVLPDQPDAMICPLCLRLAFPDGT